MRNMNIHMVDHTLVRSRVVLPGQNAKAAVKRLAWQLDCQRCAQPSPLAVHTKTGHVLLAFMILLIITKLSRS